MDSVHASFGKRLRVLRVKEGLSLRSLARSAGVSYSYLSKLENGTAKCLPKPAKIKAISQVVQVPTFELLNAAGMLPLDFDGGLSSEEARQFFYDLSKATPADWRALAIFLQRRLRRARPKPQRRRRSA